MKRNGKISWIISCALGLAVGQNITNCFLAVSITRSITISIICGVFTIFSIVALILNILCILPHDKKNEN